MLEHADAGDVYAFVAARRDARLHGNKDDLQMAMANGLILAW